MDEIRNFLTEHYMLLKFIHVIFAMIWVWSTSVAYISYVVPVFRQWLANPDEPETTRMRNWVMERFDHGVILEHVAFPILLVTGPMLMLAGGWTLGDNWLAAKLVLIVLVFIPIEIVDYWLSHFGGNKRRLRDAGATADYEAYIHRHWWFLVVATPIISIFAIGVLFLAIVKPF